MSLPSVTVVTPTGYLENAPPTAPLFVPSQTMLDFVAGVSAGPNEPMRLCLLQGPRGEGKTTAGIYACIAVAERLQTEGKGHLLPIRVAVVRDTWTNLERTTLVSFEENAAKGLDLSWKEGRKEALLGDWCHFYFFGLDNRKDCDKLQGFQCGLLWLEEVAPAADLATGIPAESLAIGTTSVRQAGVPKRIIVTFNPPDEDHWILSVEKMLSESGQRDIAIKKYVIGPGEKSEHFRQLALEAARIGQSTRAKEWADAAKEFDAYRSRNRLMLDAVGRWDLVARLVEGKVGGVAMGESIVPYFNQDQHVQDISKDGFLLPVPGIPILRGWDGGLTPSTVWAQILPNGALNVLGARTSINTGMADHIEDQVFKFQRKLNIMPKRGITQDVGAGDRIVDSSSGSHLQDDPDWKKRAGGFQRGATGNYDFEDIGDPALWKGNEHTKSEQTSASIIENLLGTTITPGPVPWSARREALLLAFRRSIAGTKGRPGRPFIKLNPREPIVKEGVREVLHNDIGLLIKGLNGRAHYPVDPATGRINDTVMAMKRVSGIYFQALDSLAYILAVKAPADSYGKRQPPRRRPEDTPPPPRSWMGL
jgi:hypothetical protein